MKTLLIAIGLAVFSSLPALADNYSWGNVVFEGGGFVDGIVPSRTQAGLVYARTDVGGAYRWDSTGGRWIPLVDWISEPNLGLYGTEAIALDPNDPARLYLLCGTSYFSGGKTMILRSGDYGATFDTVNVTSQFVAHGNGMGRQSGEKLAVDPQNGAILFCGTRTKGLFRSADSGKTWAVVSGTTVTAGTDIVNDIGVSYILFDSTSGLAANGGTKTIWMGVGSTTQSLYVSHDGGVSFTAVSGAPSQMAMRAVLSRGNLYGTFSAGPGPFNQTGGSVWKLSVASGTWTDISPKDDSGFTYATGHEGYGYAFGGITVDPADPARILLSTEGCYGGNYTWPDGKNNAGDIVFLSQDSGATWTDLNPWSAATPTADSNGNAWISGTAVHWAGTLEFDPFNDKHVWVGSGNGVFRTDDITASVPVWRFQSHGIEETVPMDIASVPGGPLVTAIMDYDGATYDDITVSQPQHTHPIGSDNSLGYAAQVAGFLRSGRVTDYSVSPSVTYDVLYHSADSGHTWTATDTSTLPGSAGSLAMSADGRVYLQRPSNLHSGTNSSASTFYRSADGGKTWSAVTGLSTQDGRMVADPVNPANFYIIPDGYQGDVYGSTDTGKTFSVLSSLLNNATGLYSASSGMLRAAPDTSGDLWVGLDAAQSWTTLGYSSYGLAHSTDGGKTWTRLTTMNACLTVGLGKAAPGASYYALYMWGMANGGPLGIYRSIDKGQTWTRINDDQHQFGGPANGNFVTGDFNVYGRVYMSTAGRGVVYGNIGALSTGISVASRRSATQGRMVLDGRTLRVQLSGATGRVEVMDLQGRMLASSPVSGVADISLGGHGIVLARLSAGGAAIQVRRFVVP
jgi:hypothetical protein